MASYEYLLNFLLPELSDSDADHPAEQRDAEADLDQKSG